MSVIAQGSLRFATVYDSSKVYNGYTIFNPLGQSDVWLIDMQGQFVHHWRIPHVLRDMGVLLSNGNLLCGDKIPEGPSSALPGVGEELLEMNWNGDIVWKYEDPYMNSHEHYRMKNGNTMITHWEPIPHELASRVKGGIPGSERDGTMWGDVLQEISPDGNVVWECPVYELLDPGTDILCPLCPRETWTYINSVVVLPDENILVSLRLLNTIAIIDKNKRKIKWRWGHHKLGHQHNPTMIDNGNILIFDNGLHTQISSNGIGSCTRVLEVNPKTNKIEWEYKDRNKAKFYTPVCGSAQRLPNDNTLICESTKGRLFEVTPDKEVVWEFFNPFYHDYLRGGLGWINIVYRAQRYAPDYEGLRGKILDSNKFEWVLQERGKPKERKISAEQEEVVRTRLEAMGY